MLKSKTKLLSAVLFVGVLLLSQSCIAMSSWWESWQFSRKTSGLNNSIKKLEQANDKLEESRDELKEAKGTGSIIGYPLAFTSIVEEKRNQLSSFLNQFLKVSKKEEQELNGYLKCVAKNPGLFLESKPKIDRLPNTDETPEFYEKGALVMKSFKECFENAKSDRYQESLCKSAFILFSNQYLKGTLGIVTSLNKWIADPVCAGDWRKVKNQGLRSTFKKLEKQDI